MLGRALGGYAPTDLVIRERQQETPMAFAYGGHEGEEAEQTATDPADSTRTARRDSLSEDDAAELLRQIDGPPPSAVHPVQSVHSGSRHGATATQELSADDILEAETLEIPGETLEIPGEPPTLQMLPQEAPEPSATLPSLPPCPESTPTLPASEAPKTPALAAAAARALSALSVNDEPHRDHSPITTKPTSKPPSTMPTMIAPKSLGIPSRNHTDLFEDLLRAPVPQMRQLAGALGGARISHGDHPPVSPILDLEVSEKAPVTRRSTFIATPVAIPVASVIDAPSQRVTPVMSGRVISALVSAPVMSAPVTGPATHVPRTQPYPFSAPIDPELAPVTEPASLPIPLFVEAPQAPEAPDAPESAPVPLARMIEASIESVGARPTLESAQPPPMWAAMFPPTTKADSAAPSPWAHGQAAHAARDLLLDAPVRPLVLPDMSGAVPVQPTFDPRLAHLDYAEGLARRQQAERAAAERTTAPPRRSRALLVAFAAFAVLIAATLFCAAVLMLQQGASTGTTASAPTQRNRARPALAPIERGAPPTSAAQDKLPIAVSSAVSSAGAPAKAPKPSLASASLGAAVEEKGIPVLAVDLLPRVPSSRGVLHVGKQFDGHRVFVDGAVVGNGSGDYELACGRHGVKVGSQDRSHAIVVPCGGELSL